MKINNNLIPSIPDLPSELYVAHLQEKLAIFIGAGVSRLAGCESWEVLAANLLSICREKKLINYYEEEKIKNFSDNKRKITIAKELLFNNGSEKEFYECFKNSLDFNRSISFPFFTNIKKLGDIYITTNADKCFESIIPDKDTKKDWNYESVKPEKKHLYHIHGHQSDNKSLVFTASEYHKRYIDESFIKFLKEVFKDYTVLFIGYGLAEFELLDYIMKNSPLRDKEIPDHYILQAYNSFERKISDCDALYYKELNVNLIPFSKDENGYKQLIEIISNWSDRISDKNDINANKLQVFDNIFSIQNINSEDASKILCLIDMNNNDDPLLYRLVKKCYSNPKLASLFVRELQKNDYYNPSHNPEPVSKGDNLYSIRSWNILDIAEICFDEALKNDNKEDIQLIKNIIDKIILTNKVDNYHTAEWLINNIFKLPEKDISKQYINYISKSLDSNFDTMLQSQALYKAFKNKVLLYSDIDLIFSIFEKILSLKQNNSRTYLKMDLYYFNQLIISSYEVLAKKDSKKCISIIENCLNHIPENTYEYLVAAFYYNSNNILETDEMYGTQTIINLYLWLLKQREDIQEYITLKTNSNNFIGNICKKLITNGFTEKKYSHTNGSYEFSYSDELEIKKNLFTNLKIEDVIQIIKTKASEKLNVIQEQSILSSFHFWLIDNYEAVLNKINAFFMLNIFWQDEIMIVTNQLITEHKSYAYEKLIPLIENTIFEDSPIWNKKDIKYPHSNELKFIKNVSEFISNFSSNIRLVKDTYLSLSRIASMIFNHRKYLFDKKNPYEIGYTTRYLNSESGKICEALFVLNNVYYNMNKSLNLEFLNILNLEITKDKKDDLFFYTIGAYLPYLYEQDKNWIDEKLNNLLRESFFEGFFSYASLNKNLYFYLLEVGFFDYVINNFANKTWITQMVKYGCSSILQGFEEITETKCLLRRIINKINPAIVDTIVNFLRRNSEETVPSKLIIQLWEYLYNAINSLPDITPYKDVLQELFYFLDYVENIDDKIYQYLELSSNYLTQYKMDHYIIPKFSELYKKNDTNKDYIEKLFLLITEKDIYFYDYKDCVTNLLVDISKHNISLARKICDKYYAVSGYDKYSDLVKEFKEIEKENNT